MENTKAEFIKGLIKTAQESIWKNELALEYADKFSDAKDKEVKKGACKHAIERDKEYIGFLNQKLDEASL